MNCFLSSRAACGIMRSYLALLIRHKPTDAAIVCCVSLSKYLTFRNSWSEGYTYNCTRLFQIMWFKVRVQLLLQMCTFSKDGKTLRILLRSHFILNFIHLICSFASSLDLLMFISLLLTAKNSLGCFIGNYFPVIFLSWTSVSSNVLFPVRRKKATTQWHLNFFPRWQFF